MRGGKKVLESQDREREIIYRGMEGDGVLRSVRTSPFWPLLLSHAVALLRRGFSKGIQRSEPLLSLLLLWLRGWQGLSFPFSTHCPGLRGLPVLGCGRHRAARPRLALGHPCGPRRHRAACTSHTHRRPAGHTVQTQQQAVLLPQVISV